MLGKIFSVKPPAWWLLAAMTGFAVISVIARSTDLVNSKTFLYVIQPCTAIAIAGLALGLTSGLSDRVRHRAEKAFLVGSVVAIWFVIYFLSGLITTYIHNSLSAGPKSFVVNIWVFAVVAVAIEISRHSILLLVSRRNIVWFGVVVALVLGLQQLNFGLLQQADGLDGLIKVLISDFVPVILSSFLLTYLALTGGLPAMLVYRLGLVAMIILPPIIPKYDWYLQGVSLILLAVTVYITVDRTRPDLQQPSKSRRRHHQKRAYDIMLVALMCFMVLFMTGVFTYKPVVIVSNSMKPVFSRGSVVVVQKIRDPMDVKVGDIVQYKRKDRMITHRVVAIDAAADGSGKRVFIIKGDNNPSQDPLVEQSQLVGIVRSQVPYIGYPTVWLQETAKNAGQS